MAEARHILRKQTLELSMPSAVQAHVLQEEVRRIYYARVVPVMDEVLSSMAGNGEVVRLERIELELGRISPPQLDEQLVKRVRAELEAAVGEELRTLRERPAGTGGGRIMRAAESTLAVLRRFLETGSVPWWTPEGSAVDPQVLLDELVRTTPIEVAAMLRQVAGPAVARRLARQFSRELQRSLWSVLAPAKTAALEPVVEDWVRLLSPSTQDSWTFASFIDARGAVQFVHEQTLAYLSASPVGDALDAALSEHFAKQLAAPEQLDAAAVVERLAGRARRLLPEDSRVRRWLAEAHSVRAPNHASEDREERDPTSAPRSTDAPADERRAEMRDTPSASEGHQSAAAERITAGEPGPGPGSMPPPATEQLAKQPGPVPAHLESAAHTGSSPPPRERDPPPNIASGSARHELAETDEAYYLENAGLVLVWPYLPHFFESVGLVQDKAFRCESARQRAVLLLQHLVTRDSAWSEHLLLLNKLLCGWSLLDPVAKAIDLTEQEQHESTELLVSVIDNWSALKNTSVEGLRSAFLQREGRLAQQDQGWQLKVARTGYDVLLDKLPWGIGFVLLPWMQEPLFVEW